MWQEYWFAFAGCMYAVVLMPALLSPRTELPRTGSIMTALLMTGQGISYSSLNMPMATVMMFAGAVQWAFLAWRRPLQKTPPQEDASPDPIP